MQAVARTCRGFDQRDGEALGEGERAAIAAPQAVARGGSADRAARHASAPPASPNAETANAADRRMDRACARRVPPPRPSTMRRLQRSSGSATPSLASGEAENAAQPRRPPRPTSAIDAMSASSPSRSSSTESEGAVDHEPKRPFDRARRSSLSARICRLGAAVSAGRAAANRVAAAIAQRLVECRARPGSRRAPIVELGRVALGAAIPPPPSPCARRAARSRSRATAR